MKRFLITAIAAFCLIVTYLALRAHKIDTEEAADQEKQIITFKANDLQAIDILTNQTTSTRIRFEKKADSTWWLAEPITYPASSSVLSQILDTFMDQLYATQFTATTLAQYGLDPAAYQVVWYLTGDQKEITYIGKTAPLGDKQYISQIKNGQGYDTVQIIDGNVDYLLKKKVNEYREPGLGWQFPQNITQITFSDPQLQSWQLQQGPKINNNDNVAWQLSQTHMSVADVSEPVALEKVAQLRELMVQEFVDDDVKQDTLKKYGFTQTSPRLYAVSATEQIELRFGASKDDSTALPVWIVGRNQLVTIAQHQYKLIAQLPGTKDLSSESEQPDLAEEPLDTEADHHDHGVEH